MIFLLFILGIKDINYKNLFPFYTLKTNEFFNNLNVFIAQPFLETTFLFNIFSKIEESKVKKNIFKFKFGINETSNNIIKEYKNFIYQNRFQA